MGDAAGVALVSAAGGNFQNHAVRCFHNGVIVIPALQVQAKAVAIKADSGIHIGDADIHMVDAKDFAVSHCRSSSHPLMAPADVLMYCFWKMMNRMMTGRADSTVPAATFTNLYWKDWLMYCIPVATGY